MRNDSAFVNSVAKESLSKEKAADFIKNQNAYLDSTRKHARRESGWAKDELLKREAKGIPVKGYRQELLRKKAEIMREAGIPEVVEKGAEQASKRRQELANQLRRKKNLKIAGKTALGVGLASGLAYGAKKLYDKNKKSKEFSETKENASKGLAYGSTATGIGALGATAASLGYNAKAIKRGLENSAAYEGKTLGELLKSKRFKDATTRVKRAINNREAKASNIAGKAGKIAGGLAAASIAMGAGSKLLKGKSDKKK